MNELSKQVRLDSIRFYLHQARKTLLTVLTVSVLSGCAAMARSEFETDIQQDEISSVSLEELILEGDEAFKSGDIDSAQVSYALAVERAPENVEALFKLGFIHSETSSLSVAESVLRHALNRDPEHMASKQTLAMVMMRVERLDEADALFGELVEDNPSGWEAYNGLGVVRDMQGRHSEAQTYFGRALELKPRSARLMNNLGYSYYMAAQYDEAEEYLRKAIQLDSEYNRAWSNLALLFSREGRYRDASAAFKKIVREHQAANNLGYLGMLQGDKSLAKEQLNQAIKLSPSYYDVANRNLENIDDVKRTATKPVRSIGPTEKPLAKVGYSATGKSSKDVSAAAIPRVRVGPSTSQAIRVELQTAQTYLNFIGFDAGPSDGRMGDITRNAVKEFQKVAEIDVDGSVGPQTSRILLNSVVLKVQKTLVSFGYSIKLKNGVLDETTRNAIRKFQRDQKLPVSGDIDSLLITEIAAQSNRLLDDFNSILTPDLTARG